MGPDLGDLSFSGRLSHPEGRGADRVSLILRPRFPWNYVEFWVFVGSHHESRFHFRGLKPGDYDVEVLDWSDRRRFPLTTLRLEEDVERDLEFSRD